jgi:glycosyltransferase involved in cell wall biosynthesis
MGSTGKLKITVVTYMPSPYQVELLNAVAGSGDVRLDVVYVFSNRGDAGGSFSPAARAWGGAEVRHQHVNLDDGEKAYSTAADMVDRSDLVVFSYYRHPVVGTLIRRRAASGKKWAFWGERPGYHLRGLLGSVIARSQLAPLYVSDAPIWGIGEWAVDGYIERFGWKRRYFNVPYFSDLSRLGGIGIREKSAADLTFLFSGSLIRRKGVDLLASVFKKLALRYPGVRLRVTGDGPMRSRMEKELSFLRERVEFRGFLPYGELTENYGGADVLCVPSRYDGWGMVVPEGLAAALPVISSDRTGAAREFIRRGVNGWVVPAGESGALYSTMSEVAELSEEALLKYSINARISVSQHSLENGVERFISAAEGSMGASIRGVR